MQRLCYSNGLVPAPILNRVLHLSGEIALGGESGQRA